MAPTEYWALFDERREARGWREVMGDIISKVRDETGVHVSLHALDGTEFRFEGGRPLLVGEVGCRIVL